MPRTKTTQVSTTQIVTQLETLRTAIENVDISLYALSRKDPAKYAKLDTTGFIDRLAELSQTVEPASQVFNTGKGIATNGDTSPAFDFNNYGSTIPS